MPRNFPCKPKQQGTSTSQDK